MTTPAIKHLVAARAGLRNCFSIDECCGTVTPGKTERMLGENTYVEGTPGQVHACGLWPGTGDRNLEGLLVGVA